MDLPLDAFIHDVPEDRVFVSANFHSLFTNAFFIRNNEVGRELALDWLAIVHSGWVQCHGFDQVCVYVPVWTEGSSLINRVAVSGRCTNCK